MSGPTVTCICCGRTDNHGMRILASPIHDPHRWVCRDRKACLERAPNQVEVSGFGDGIYLGAGFDGEGTSL